MNQKRRPATPDHHLATDEAETVLQAVRQRTGPFTVPKREDANNRSAPGTLAPFSPQ